VKEGLEFELEELKNKNELNPNVCPSDISRKEFAKWRKRYWKHRALDFINKGENNNKK
jgi:hypothetical protein